MLFHQDISTFVCNCFRGNLPVAFSYYLQTFDYQYDTCEKLTRLVVPTCRTELGKKTVKNIGSNIWNDISQEQRSIKYSKAFRKAIKDNILDYPTAETRTTSN